MENENAETKIKEVIKVRDGKPVYCLQVEQGESKMQIYIRNGDIYFESCSYGFDKYPVFDLNNEAHQIAKECFTTSLKASIKNKILELKQLEVILDQLSLKDIINDELRQGGLFLSLKHKLLEGDK